MVSDLAAAAAAGHVDTAGHLCGCPQPPAPPEVELVLQGPNSYQESQCYPCVTPGPYRDFSGRITQALEVTSQKQRLSWSFPQQEPRLPWSCLVALADPQLSSSLCSPESRCDKDLDTLSGYALCLPNLARLQTYQFAERRPILCVEIKVNIC